MPFIVEAGVAYGGKAGRVVGDSVGAEIMRFANRAPLLFDAGADVITKVVNEVDWNRYGLKKVDTLPVSIIVNVVSTYIPYTSAGKQAIADIEEIHKEVKFALMEVGRQIGGHIRRERKKYEKQTKKMTLLKYVPEVAAAVAALTGDNKKELEMKLVKMIEKKYSGNGADEEEGEEQ